MLDPGVLEAARGLASRALEELSRHDGASSTVGLPALLRLCLRLLPSLDAGDPGLAVRCRRRLLDSLRDVLSRDPSPSLLPALEVFAEALVVSHQLRSSFSIANCAAQAGTRPFTVALPCRGEFHTLLELVCCHFISSLEGEGGFEAFLSALSWSGKESLGAPEFGFEEAFLLGHRTCMFSLPAAVQAHLFLLASRCISGPDLKSHLIAFELSMNLYVEYLPALGVFNRTGGLKTPQHQLPEKMPFSCCIKDVTDQKLRSQINELLSFCQSHSCDALATCESDIFHSFDRFIDDNQHMLHEKFRKQATIVVKSIMANIMHCAMQKEMHESDAEVTEEIICLAAVLRLMGSLLLQIRHCFSQMRAVPAHDRTNANHVAVCVEYNAICENLCLLGQYEANELHRCDLLGIIGLPVDREKASMLMLAHFASLSVFCVRRRLGFLWRVCIIMMMMAINLVITEEGNMDMFQFLIDASKESADIPNTEEGKVKVYGRRRSSRVIALKLATLQTPRVEKTDGRAFLECHPEYNCNSLDSLDDIMDFIECEQGKDYANLWNQLTTFRTFKNRIFRWKQNSVKETMRNEKLVSKTKIRKRMPRRKLR